MDPKLAAQIANEVKKYRAKALGVNKDGESQEDETATGRRLSSHGDDE